MESSNGQSSKLPDSLVETYGPLVSSFCRKMLQNPDMAADAAQEAWLEILKSYPSFQNRAKLSTWIYTIAYRVVMRYAAGERIYSTRFLRSYFRGEDIESPAATDLDHKLWVKEMCDKCLTGILHCLDNESRIAYIFRDVANVSYAEIAVILGKEEPAVRQFISRSRRKLKNFLADECLLFNPNGRCQCRMRKMVQNVDLPAEYAKLRASVGKIDFFRQSEQIMPGKNYWKKFI